jgi:kynurenine 3-monooxygenase
MRDKVGDKQFLFQKEVEKILQREFPDRYISRYSMVTFTRLPYRTALKAGEAQARILTDLCRGLQRPEDVDLKKAQGLIERWL